ncbi:carbohydrate binding domain-containing protein [Corallincola platygyrae]|uniref:endo-1,4-beta-xylanase n=1 Tax=Corallincola platygyrae TaxID=1193278 RepID=A0ABW4XHH7_9GAMM
MLAVHRKVKGFAAGVGLCSAALLTPLFACANEVVDVMVLYTSAEKARQNGAIDTHINHLVAATNTMYATSNMGIRLRLVHSREMNIAGVDQMGSNELSLLRSNTTVRNLRTQYGADVVTMLAASTNSICGIGYVGGGSNGRFSSYARDYAYNMVGCGATTFAHEIGHNIGLAHSRKQGDTGGVFDYGLGYGVDNQFVTVMAYPSAFGTYNSLSRFSDPTTSACNGYACGVSKEYSNGADAVSAINAVASQIANWYPTEVDGGNPGDGGEDCQLPAKPGKPVASDIGSSSYTAAWSTADNAATYQVQRWAGAWQNYSVTTSTQVDITGETGDVAYSRVIGINSCGEQGEPSDWVKVELQSDTGGPGEDCSTPAKPNQPNAENITRTSFDISWGQVSGAATYQVLLWNGAQRVWEEYTTTAETQVTVTGIAEDVAYVAVVGVNRCGTKGQASSWIAVTMQSDLPPDNGENLISNGSFENGSIAGWSEGFSGRINLIDSSHTGSYALAASNRTNWYDGVMQEMTGVIQPSKTYDISAWVRMAAGTDRVRIQVWYQDGAGAHWLDPIQQNVSADWSQLKGSIQLNVSGNLQYVRLFIMGPQPGQTFYLDDVTLTER